jgi:hypothetical protein
MEKATVASANGQRVDDIVLALAAAESLPGYSFIALKWFRDTYLPAQNASWAISADARHETLSAAIRDGIFITSKIPNPNRPGLSTTVLRLNRTHPTVRGILGVSVKPGWDFTPLEIRGEPLSETILRDRG